MRLLNGVLSGYGLPTFAITGLQAYNGDEDDGFSFLYPRGWVLRANSQRPGVYAADFQTADKVVVEVLKAGAEVADVVAACVSPGSSDGGDSRLELPPPQKVRCALLRVVAPAGAFLPLESLTFQSPPPLRAWEEGGLRLFAFPSETTTRSGYNVRRLHLAALVGDARKNRSLAICASSRSDLWSTEKEALLARIIQSFQVVA